MKVLVTGGSGFIGESLCRQLDIDGHEVINWNYRNDSADETLLQLDLLLEGIEMVIHAQANTHRFGPKRAYEDINIELTRKILALCLKRQVSGFLYLSDARLDWIQSNVSYYFTSKLNVEKFILKVGESQQIKCMSLRLPLVMGIKTKARWQQEMIELAHKNRLCLIGDGENKKDVLFIDEAINGIVCALKLFYESLDNYNGKIYRLSANEMLTWEELLQLNLKMVGISDGPRFISGFRARLLASFLEGLYLFFGIFRPMPYLTKSFYWESVHDDAMDNKNASALLPDFKSTSGPVFWRNLVVKYREEVDQIFRS